MSMFLRLTRIRKILKTFLHFLIFILLGLSISLAIHMYLWKVWFTSSTWKNMIIEYPVNRNDLDLKLLSSQNDLNFSLNYALFYKIEKENKVVKYKFSLLPYSQIADAIKSGDKGVLNRELKPDVVLTINNFKPTPEVFLNRELLTEDSYTTPPFTNKIPVIPVKLNLVLDITKYRNPTLWQMVKHWWKVKVRKITDIYPFGLKSWKIEQKQFAHEYFSNKSDEDIEQYLDNWADGAFSFYNNRVTEIIRENDITTNKGKIEAFNKLADIFSSPYLKCSIKDFACTDEGELSPGSAYLIYLYGLFYVDLQKYDILKRASYEYFANYTGKAPVYGKNEMVKWSLIVPYIVPITPAQRDPGLDELFTDTVKILFERGENSPVLELQPYDVIYKVGEAPPFVWGDHQESLAFTSADEIVYRYLELKEKNKLNSAVFEQMNNDGKKLFYTTLALRYKHRFEFLPKYKVHLPENYWFLFEYPVDKRKLAEFIYNNTEFNAYKYPLVESPNSYLVDPNSFDNKKELLDKLLSLMFVYEIKASK